MIFVFLCIFKGISVISMIFVFLCIFKGIKLSGKITIYTACAPYILLFILLARGIFLEGATNGLIYLLEPDLSKLFSLSVWVDAVNQVFFQFSMGICIFYDERKKMNIL